MRFPLRHDVDAASVTYLRDFDLTARAVDTTQPLPRQDQWGDLTVFATPANPQDPIRRQAPPPLSERLRRRGHPSSLDVVHKANRRA